MTLKRIDHWEVFRAEKADYRLQTTKQRQERVSSSPITKPQERDLFLGEFMKPNFPELFKHRRP